MNTWAPIFSKIVSSSLWSEEDWVVKVFLTMLARKDSDQIVRGTAFEIGEWSKKGEKIALEALKILSSPDTKRIEKQPYDGRRIQRVEEGWLILNGLYYEQLMRKANRGEYQRIKQGEYRAKKRGKPLKGETAYLQGVKNGTIDPATEQVLKTQEPIVEPTPPAEIANVCVPENPAPVATAEPDPCPL